MHLRSGTNALSGTHPKQQQPKPTGKSLSVGQTSFNRISLTKKIFLWLMLILQICFIACFWFLQSDLNVSNAVTTPVGLDTTGELSPIHAKRVNFVSTKPESAELVDKSRDNFNPSTNFKRDFYLKPNRLNTTGFNDIGLGIADVMEKDYEVWCFRDGTINETTSITELNHEEEDEENLLFGKPEQCKCLPNWHGKDCGQPEIIWRALMMAKGTFQMVNPQQNEPHRLVVMLEGNFFSLEFLELQIKAIEEAVDYFLIYLRNSTTKPRQSKALQRKLKIIFANERKYFLLHCTTLKFNNQNCSTGNAYKYFRKHIHKLPITLQGTDLLLYANDQVVISKSALKFLKYYAADVRLLRFRLKYNVYGFYWQHPGLTQIAGVLSSFKYLDNPTIGNEDPNELLNQTTAKGVGLIVGDLNHFGGWFCKYCLQAEEIISELYTETSSLRHVQFPNDTKDHLIDANYLQKLIGNGIYIDGRTQLQRVRRDSDLYHAPAYAKGNSWKYGHLLVNLYETIEEDDLGEEIS